ncbi:MAG: type III pantothenate kinase [Nitrosomonas sp.]|nr:MAG: type III pantothenate kinase [Nitrosomonas sp.]
MHYTLAIDCGNTNLKWGIYANQIIVRSDAIPYQDIDCFKSEIKQLPAPESIIISHVSCRLSKDEICELLSDLPIKIYWLRASASLCGIHNGYTNPSQLGSDRWAALIAAWNLNHRACLVINVGTAMTIDALNDSGVHLGGVILPSGHIMFKSLVHYTMLPNAERDGLFRDFPSNTEDAIKSGTIQSLLGVVDRLYLLLSNAVQHTKSICFFSGGGAKLILPYILYPHKFVDNLVLDGLILAAKEIRKKSSV